MIDVDKFLTWKKDFLSGNMRGLVPKELLFDLELHIFISIGYNTRFFHLYEVSLVSSYDFELLTSK